MKIRILAIPVLAIALNVSTSAARATGYYLVGYVAAGSSLNGGAIAYEGFSTTPVRWFGYGTSDRNLANLNLYDFNGDRVPEIVVGRNGFVEIQDWKTGMTLASFSLNKNNISYQETNIYITGSTLTVDVRPSLPDWLISGPTVSQMTFTYDPPGDPLISAKSDHINTGRNDIYGRPLYAQSFDLNGDGVSDQLALNGDNLVVADGAAGTTTSFFCRFLGDPQNTQGFLSTWSPPASAPEPATICSACLASAPLLVRRRPII